METIEFVCKFFNYSVDEVLSGSRKRLMMDIKRMIVHLMLKEGYGVSRIGSLMRYRDHTTAMWQRDRFQDLIVTDKAFRLEFKRLENAIKNNNTEAADEITCFA